MDDEKYYQAVADELREGRINDGLWTKALARCMGDENKTKATYIQWRVEQLMQAERQMGFQPSENTGEGSAEEEEASASAQTHWVVTVLKWVAVIALSGVIIWAVKFLLWPKLQTYIHPPR